MVYFVFITEKNNLKQMECLYKNIKVNYLIFLTMIKWKLCPKHQKCFQYEQVKPLKGF